MKQRKHGFTLVELLTIVAILGLFTTLSVAALGPLRDRYNLRQATELAAAAAARAQLLARESGRCHTLQVYTVDASGNASPKGIGSEGNHLRVQRRTTADCGDSLEASPHEHVEWVRMPGRTRIWVPAGTSEPEWRPNSRLREGATELRVAYDDKKGEQLVIQLMTPGAVCVSDLPLGACP
jgi:type II secretory pathway pseudopilin PulG